MSASDTSSERGARWRWFAVTAAAVVLAAAGPAWATALISVDEALSLAFAGAVTERETVFLTETQLAQAAAAAGERPAGAIVTRYRAERDGALVGWAYLDTHRVRTLPETVMVVLDPSGQVLRVEVVAFREPLEYLPRPSWYGQLEGRRLDGEVNLDRGIRPVAGATLTAVATVRAVRQVLAIHGVLAAEEGS
jgi:hypothetical protein